MIIVAWIVGVIVWLLLGYIAASLLKSRIERKMNEPAGPEFIPWRIGYTASGLLGLLVYFFLVVTNADSDLYQK